MTAIIGQIKSIFTGFNGVFVKEYEYIHDPELLEFEEEYLSDIEMVQCTSDKLHIKGDMYVVLNDLKSVVKKKSVTA